MAKKVPYDFHDQGPSPKVGEKRLNPPVHIKGGQIVVTAVIRDWVYYKFTDGRHKHITHSAKMRRYLWNNLKRSHK
jgi:hypothetical protein